MTAPWIRAGLVLLVVAGASFVVALPLRGAFVDPGVNPEAFVASASLQHATLGYLLTLCGTALATVGVVALGALLHPRAPRLALWGAATSIVANVLVAPLFGFLASSSPLMAARFGAGDPDGIAFARANISEPSAFVPLAAAAVLLVVGSTLLAIALWRTRIVARPFAVAYALQAPLFMVPATIATEYAGALCFLATSIALVVAARTR